MTPNLPFQKDVVIILKQAHGNATRFESIEANDILTIARLCCVFDLWSDRRMTIGGLVGIMPV